jgi:hypothetical protein
MRRGGEGRGEGIEYAMFERAKCNRMIMDKAIGGDRLENGIE